MPRMTTLAVFLFVVIIPQCDFGDCFLSHYTQMLSIILKVFDRIVNHVEICAFHARIKILSIIYFTSCMPGYISFVEVLRTENLCAHLRPLRIFK